MLLFESILWTLFFPLDFVGKIHYSVDVLTLCFSEKLPAAGNLAFNSEGNDIEWNEQGFPPQIQRAALTTVYYRKKDMNTRKEQIIKV